MKKKSLAETSLRTAHILRQEGKYPEALKNYDEALTYYDAGEFNAYSYDAHKGRLICYYENKDDAAFQAELPNIFTLFRDYRKKISEEENRSIFFDNEQDVYDIAIDHEFNRSDYNDAFDYSEESRARSLLDLQSSPIEVSKTESLPEIKLPANTIEPQKLSQIQPRIPANVQLCAILGFSRQDPDLGYYE